MNRLNLWLAVLALGLSFFAVSPRAEAAQSYDNCVGYVASIPAVINKQGTWCLNKDVSSSIASGIAIDIQANNVTLDCNDFKIGGLGAGITTRTIGINAVGRSNITIRNCAVRGFFYGLNLEGSGQVVENNRFDGNTWIAIGVEGDGSTVRGNRVTTTGGASGFGNEIKAVGIYTRYGVDIEDNLVSDVVAAAGSNGFAIGINPGDNPAGVIRHNRIRNVFADGTGWGDGISLWGAETDRVTVTENQIVNTSGSAQTVGILCFEIPGNHVLLLGNVLSGFGIASENCIDPGENYIVP